VKSVGCNQTTFFRFIASVEWTDSDYMLAHFSRQPFALTRNTPAPSITWVDIA